MKRKHAKQMVVGSIPTLATVNTASRVSSVVRASDFLRLKAVRLDMVVCHSGLLEFLHTEMSVGSNPTATTIGYNSFLKNVERSTAEVRVTVTHQVVGSNPTVQPKYKCGGLAESGLLRTIRTRVGSKSLHPFKSDTLFHECLVRITGQFTTLSMWRFGFDPRTRCHKMFQ